MATVGTAVFLLYRRITLIGKLGAFLWVGVIVTDPVDHFYRRDALQPVAGVHVSSRCVGR